jgi:spore coat polysaccharide biosynthesis protein SpsF (cytidylyltransferase family)/sialic acid synthase SpsE
MPYILAEVANIHSGSYEYLTDLVKEVSALQGVDGIKFQPFRFDTIALPDYTWYPVYEKLYFTPEQWREVIALASQKLEVWVDTFDEYSCRIIEENLPLVKGVKLQASILYNAEVFGKLAALDLSHATLALNISGLAMPDIDAVVKQFTEGMKVRKIILQIGFQSYPTKVEDAGLVKIETLRDTFGLEVSFADHAEAASPHAMTLPLVALGKGATHIEKHVRITDRHAEYDTASAITLNQFEQLVADIAAYAEALAAPFINEAEASYLLKTRQIPVTRHALQRGSLLRFEEDLTFRRSDLPGLTVQELQERRDRGCIVAREVKAHQPILAEDLKQATVTAVIACRLKSSRLKRKAVLPIGSLPSIEMCIRNAMRLQGVNQVVLATSDTEEDAELGNFTFDPSVVFHRGHPEDVIHRYLGILDQLRSDILVRITGDMPYVSAEITEILLREHLRTGADFTHAKNFAVGTATEIISVQALHRVKRHFPEALYSEYMSWYFTNNPKHFRIHTVELPENLVRPYRLTLDYQEDLDLFNAIEAHLSEKRLAPTTENIFRFLDANPEVANLNAHIALTYKTDPELIRTLHEHTTIR